MYIELFLTFCLTKYVYILYIYFFFVLKFLLVAVVAVIDGGHPKLATTPYVPVKYCKHPSGPRNIDL